MNPTVSMIISSYNWPVALSMILDKIADQDCLPLEVVIADDGSTDDTRQVIERYQQWFPCPIVHVWHSDQGYRLAAIRNKAAATAKGEYLIFLDSDCLMRRDFVSRHLQLSKPNHFVAGNRVLLSESYTKNVIDGKIDIVAKSAFSFSRSQLNRRWSLLQLPMGIFRHIHKNSWSGVKTCNVSMYRSDFLTTNGFEESFEGWGYEDTDLVVRLLKIGVKRISGRFAVTVFHLWHGSFKSTLSNANWDRLQETIGGTRVRAKKGVDQHFEQ